MNKALALVYYERLMPGSQLVNRLQDLGYRVVSLTEGSLLVETARREKPMVVLVDLVSSRASLGAMIKELRAHAETGHIPVIAFAAQKETRLLEEATRAGAALVAYDDVVLPQLPRLLEHALSVE